jgi:hypothetical protein
MGAVPPGGGIAEHIESLEARYGDFSVDQTTIAVAQSVFDRARERAQAGLVDAIVRVWNEDGDVLHTDDGERSLPRRRGVAAASLEPVVRTTIQDEFEVACTIDGIERVTIAGIRNRDGPEADPIYRLFVVVDASYAGGTTSDGVWRALDPHRPITQPV